MIPDLYLTPIERRIITTILAFQSCSNDKIYDALYGTFSGNKPDKTCVKVHVCKLKKKLSAAGTPIETVKGRFQKASDETRARLKAHLEACA